MIMLVFGSETLLYLRHLPTFVPPVTCGKVSHTANLSEFCQLIHFNLPQSTVHLHEKHGLHIRRRNLQHIKNLTYPVNVRHSKTKIHCNVHLRMRTTTAQKQSRFTVPLFYSNRGKLFWCSWHPWIPFVGGATLSCTHQVRKYTIARTHADHPSCALRSYGAPIVPQEEQTPGVATALRSNKKQKTGHD